MLTSGTRIGPYEIVAPIGAGGMGEVYRARDSRLARDVAIKVLPAAFASDPDRLRRFEQEARATAALNHPNILAVHDVGSYEDSPYLVEELLEGESLRERLKGGALPLRKAIDIAGQIARGLAAAHDKGIIHRDLKPENVFVTSDGTVKILDFGLAKLARGDSEADLSTLLTASAPQAVVGTAAYMAPEQVRGLAIDHRADIFAFGCVSYEMLSAKRPFSGETAADTMTAILSHEPVALPSSPTDEARALERIVRRCLEKRPEERFQSARDLAHDLCEVASEARPAQPPGLRTTATRLRTAVLALGGAAVVAAAALLTPRLATRPSSVPATKVPRIIVLPFDNLGAPEDAYFASGMTEEITSRLSNVQGLGVISRTSAMEYAHRGKTVKEIGAELGVDYVLEGGVRWEHEKGRESRVRITPQLIRVADDTHVWADRYDRVLADVFAMQSEVAESVVKAMGVALLPHEKTKLNEISTNDLEAYDLYLRGTETAKGVADSPHLEGALEMYQAAVDRDSHFAQALAGLAIQHLSMYWLHNDRSQERLVKAKEAAERAVELRPDLAETHTALGMYFYQGLLDYPRALSEFSAALKIQPNNSDALAAIGYVLRRQGHWAESVEKLGKALEFDPRNAQLLYSLGGTSVLARRYAEADRALARTIALSAQSGDAYGDRASLQIAWHGDVEKAQALVGEAGRVAGLHDEGHLAWLVQRVALIRRDYSEALRQIDQATRRTPEGRVMAFRMLDSQWGYSPAALLRAQVLRVAGQQGAALQAFEAARVELEREVALDSRDSRFHSSLGIAYAGLGRTEEAVREARLACDLMPASKDAMKAPYRLQDLALVYTMTGQADDAIATLDRLLAASGEFTVNWLRLEPRWDPLRSDPRFQALLVAYAVKE